MDFYRINEDYNRYLQRYEKENRGVTKVPNIRYTDRNKFAFGAVMQVNGMNYYVSVSSFDKKQEANILIRVPGDEKEIKGSLRFNYMIPVPEECIERLVIPFLVGRTNNVNGDYINDKFASAIFGGTSSNSNSTMMPKILKEFILTNETDIPDYAFKNCSYLEKVFIPLSVEKMGYHVFENCPNLILYYEGDDYPSSWSNEWDLWHCVCFNYNRWWERF